MSLPAAARTVLHGPWSARAWLGTAHVAVGSLIGSVTSSVILGLIVTTAPLIPTVLPWLSVMAVLLWCNRWFSACQRSRFAVFLGVHIPPSDGRPEHASRGGGRGAKRTGGAGLLRRTVAELAAPTTGRQLVYHLFTGTLSTVGLVAIAVCWAAGILLSTIAVYAWALPGVNAAGWQLHDARVLAGLTVVGLVALFAAPWVVRGVTTMDTLVGQAMLGPTWSADLAHRVQSLTRSRAGVVDAADAERRRIERDLHDGVQQRLTSLAVNLGIARATLGAMPEPARKAIAHAHDEAQEALAELTSFVRGLHPAVLEDRGLAAAIPGLAARSPVPVRLDIDLPARPPPPIEATAYFVVSESLTNVVKHARASSVEVTAHCHRDRLRIQVTDDGCGGARPSAGSGLRGLAQRVDSVDGTLRIDSPAGGPTRVAVELPCEW